MLTLFEQDNPYICLHRHHVSRKLTTRVCLQQKPFQSWAPNSRRWQVSEIAEGRDRTPARHTYESEIYGVYGLTQRKQLTI